MKKFLAIYIGSPTSSAMTKWDALSPQERAEREALGKTNWMNWAKEHQSAILDHGAPLGRTKQANPAGISDIKNRMAAYTVVQAESHEAAAKLFVNHPHFTIFPGDSVEIMECLPMPKM